MKKQLFTLWRAAWMVIIVLLAVTMPGVFSSCSTPRTATQLVVQTAYPELPALQPGARYSDRMETVRRIAREDETNGHITMGSYDAVVSTLTPRDVRYQTDPSGQRVACIPLLAARIDGDARREGSPRMQEIFDQALKDGELFTTQFYAIAQQNGLYLDGLENAVKGASHMVEKANRWLAWWREEYHQPEATVEDVAASFNDLVRYSVVLTKDHYVEGTKALIKGLQDLGYAVEKTDNRFLGDDGLPSYEKTYRAIHLTVRAGQRLVEIQVHDYSSQAIREYTHEIYEHMRKLDENSEDYKRMAQQCIDAWRDYVNPAGIETIR